MIKLAWMQIANPYFEQAVNAIWDCPMLDGATSYTAHRIKKGIEKANKQIRDIRIEICRKYAKKGPDGKMLNDASGQIIFENPEDGPKLEADFIKEFETHFLEMEVSKLDFTKLVNVRGLTPRMWEHISPIVDNLPDAFEKEESQVVADPAPSMIEIPKTAKRKVKKG